MTVITFIKAPIARLQLNAPDTLNALNLGIVTSLRDALNECEQNPTINVVIIESLVEKAFSVGIDLKEYSVHDTHDYRNEFLNTWKPLQTFTKPIIVAINGYAFGGGLELALMGDILIASETAVFAQPELSVGTIPGLGATQRLPRIIGHHRANDFILTGHTIDATTALKWGLVSNVVSASQLQKTVTDTASIIASKSLPMLIKAKAALKASQELPLTKGLIYERDLFLSTFDLKDQQEGFNAFLQKRPPNFKDH